MLEYKIKISKDKLLEYIRKNSSFERTLFLDLGIKTVKILCFSEEFIPHLERQLTYSLKDDSSGYNETIVLWKEKNPVSVIKKKELFFIDDELDELVRFDVSDETMSLHSKDNKFYFYGVNNLDFEEFAKQGHLLVQTLYKILQTKKTNLVHGACIGLDGKGALICGRGRRGKSTLSVTSMLNGFDYIADDYLTVEQENNELYAYPIYSIIDLSPRMYNELFKKLNGARFVSNNGNKDKYVINIAAFHSSFRKKYPVKFCLFPEMYSGENPEIIECTSEEKGRAITQLVHSTIIQMNDMNNTQTVKKLINMVQNLKFYKILLCDSIDKNTDCLRDFLKNYKNGEQ